MAKENGKPIKYITLRIPIYTGKVRNDGPHRLEPRVHFKLLKEEQIVALNRMHQAYLQQHHDPARQQPSQDQVMRHMLNLVAEQCEKQGITQ